MKELQDPVAFMCEGALYCPDHCDPTPEEIADGWVTPVTRFDVMCGTQTADWLENAVCSGCGVELS